MSKKRGANGRRKKRDRKKRGGARRDGRRGALVQSMSVWEGARGSAGLVRWGDGPVRAADWVLWVEQPAGVIVGQGIVRADDDSAMVSVLETALVSPNFGAPRRPRSLRVATEAIADGLRAELGGDLQVEAAPIPKTEELGRALAAQLEQEQGAGYLDLHDVGPNVVSDLFDAACDLAAEEALLAEIAGFRINAPRLALEGVIGCMVDFGSDRNGLLVLPSAEHYREMLRANEKKAPRDSSGIAVMLVLVEQVPQRARDEIEKHGWKCTDDGRCPLLVKLGPDGEQVEATATDYRSATLVATVMADLAKNADQLRSGDQALQCTLNVSGCGDVDVLYPGDLEDDELSSIIEEYTEATICLSEEAYQAAVGVEILSPRARRVLDKAVRSNSQPGFELRAALDDFAHVGDLLMAASIQHGQHGRPEVLGEAAIRFLVASVRPPLIGESEVAAPPRRSRGTASSKVSGRSQTSKRASKRDRTLYQLKVSLRGIRPPIWRRIEVRSDMSLAGLHRVIQDTMGWYDCHLHEFECNGQRYGTPEPEFEDFGESVANENTTRLDDVLRKPKSSMTYLYDFGDGWEHRVVLEEVKPMPPGRRAPKPRCIGGRRACPPEDCGGPGGYTQMLEALEDPRHPEHTAYKEWLGAAFDPDAY